MAYSLDLLAASGVEVKKRSQWGAQYPISANSMALPGRYLFMHITVTHQTGTLDYRSRVVERIGASRFPNTRMSYTALLHRGGEVHEGQPRGRKGAHTVNVKGAAGFPYDLNAYGHALSYVGMEADDFGEAETEAAARYFAALVLSGESRATEVLPHQRFAWKACPGARVMAKLAEINRRFKKYVAAGRLPGGPTSEDEEVRPSDWNAEDRARVREAIFGENKFLNNMIVKGTDKNTAWHVRRQTAIVEQIHAALTGAPAPEMPDADEVAAAMIPALSDAVREALQDETGVDEDAVAARVVARLGALFTPEEAEGA